jgi:selenocysteine-specific elongation factor
MAIDLILGTAGHIDHGKTALVKALTGVDTDRLPEEKRRGITIDLGFAQLSLPANAPGEPGVNLGIVDVPGHERFVRTMLAGASGIDLALLAIAADDSVKPQTLEHFEILKLMNLAAGVIALTKCDVAEPDWIDLVQDEIAELVRGSFLEQAPIIRTSAKTGEGLDELRAALAQAARAVATRSGSCQLPIGNQVRSGSCQLPPSELVQTEGSLETGKLAACPTEGDDNRPFRMAIDRVFTIAGHGTVVTGSVASGRAHVGDALHIEPLGIDVRVRGLQNHDQPVEKIRRSQRAALNLAGVHHTQIGRGDELCSPGHLAPSRLLTVRLDLLASTKHPLKHRDRVKLHIGAAERTAAVAMLSRVEREELRVENQNSNPQPSTLNPQLSSLNSQLFAQLLLDRPVVATWGQPFVIRRPSPAETIGGGIVLDPNALRIRAAQAAERAKWVTQLQSDARIERAAAAIRLRDLRPWRAGDLARLAGVWEGDRAVTDLVARGDVLAVSVSPTQVQHIHREALDEVGGRVQRALARLHDAHPLKREIALSELMSSLHPALWVQQHGELIDATVRMLAETGVVRVSERGISLAGRGPQLSSGEEALLAEMVERIRAAGLQPPTAGELLQQATRNRAAVQKLLELAAADGLIVAVSRELYFHRDAMSTARDAVVAALQSRPLTVSEIREVLGTTRKFAVPLCEYFDKTGLTRRAGDQRVLK